MTEPTWQESIASIRAEITSVKEAVKLQHDDYVRVPTLLQSAIGNLKDLLLETLDTRTAHLNGRIDTFVGETLEKFAGVNGQFIERDTRTDQRAGDTKLAVDAAFAAAKEATAKIEAGFTKQIDGMVQIIDTKTSNLDSRISDLKDRITSIESTKTGGASVIAMGLATVGAAAAVVAIIVTVLLSHSTAPLGPGQVQADNAAALRELIAQNASLIAKINAAK